VAPGKQLVTHEGAPRAHAMTDASLSDGWPVKEDAYEKWSSTESTASPYASKDVPLTSYDGDTPYASKDLPLNPSDSRRDIRRQRWEAHPDRLEGRGKFDRRSFDECERTRIAFLKLLLKQHGTVLSAWKAIDENQDGKISYNEFLRASRHVGVTDPARKIFFSMDLRRSGFISVEELEPEVGHLLSSLAQAVGRAYGCTADAWQIRFNPRGFPRISAADFIGACKDFQFPGDSAMVAFQELCTDKASGISRQEFGFLDRWITDTMPAAPKRPMVTPKAASEPVLPNLTPLQMKPKQGRKDFKDLLLKSYKNFVRAWREGLDRDRNGRLDQKEFTRAVKDLGFAGNSRELWEELDLNGNGWVSLWELDEATAVLLQEFKASAEAAYGSLQMAWQEAMDTRDNDRVKILDFKEGCKLLGYKGDANKMFALLDTDEIRYLEWATVEWLATVDLLDEESADRIKTPPSKYQTLTRMQQRRADINARNARALSKQFEGRARGEIPGSNPSAGTTIFNRNVNFTKAKMPKSKSLPAIPEAKRTTEAGFFANSEPAPDAAMPEWYRIMQGKAAAKSMPKADLSFPLKPQAPGKGGWPGRNIRLVDRSWGGSKDIGDMLSPLSRAACTQYNLDRWRAMAEDER